MVTNLISKSLLIQVFIKKILGYGKVTPKNSISQSFCIFYCAIGIPLIFLVFTKLGEFLSEFYHVFEAWVKGLKVNY